MKRILSLQPEVIGSKREDTKMQDTVTEATMVQDQPVTLIIEDDERKKTPQYEITALVSAARKPSVEKKLREAFGSEAEIFCVEKVTTPESRADRLDDAGDHVAIAVEIVEELQAEMQGWMDSIPENLQGGDKASEVAQAVDDLQQLIDELQNLDFGSVSFPGMMG